MPGVLEMLQNTVSHALHNMYDAWTTIPRRHSPTAYFTFGRIVCVDDTGLGCPTAVRAMVEN